MDWALIIRYFGSKQGYVPANPVVANLSHEELIRVARPVIQRLLMGPIGG